MARIDTLIEKFYRKPIPNDIKYSELIRIANHFGCIVRDSGGKHSLKIIDCVSGTVIPIPKHGKHVKEAYIKEVKDLIEAIKEIGE